MALMNLASHLPKALLLYTNKKTALSECGIKKIIHLISKLL